jgi:hypothetical protein
MLSAGELMRQAGTAAHDWMESAADYVERRFSDYPPTERARLITAYVQAAAADELAMYVRSLTEELADAAQAVRALTAELTDAVQEIRGLGRHRVPESGTP